MARVTASAGGTGISIAVPDSWYEFDIHPDSRDDNIHRTVATRIRELPDLAPYRADITTLLRRMAREAWDSGVVYFGCMAENFEDIPLSAAVTVTLATATGRDGQPLSTGPEAIAASLAPKQATGPADTWRTVTVVDLPEVGVVARTAGVEDIRSPSDSRVIRAVLMQTFVPLPAGAPRGVAIISGSSPVLDLAESFLDVFDAVTSTFRFLAPAP